MIIVNLLKVNIVVHSFQKLSSLLNVLFIFIHIEKFGHFQLSNTFLFKKCFQIFNFLCWFSDNDIISSFHEIPLETDTPTIGKESD